MKFTTKGTKLAVTTLFTVFGSLVIILANSGRSAPAVVCGANYDWPDFAGGPPPGVTGAPGESTCAQCHSPNTQTGTFNIIPPAAYAPGQTYTVQVQHITADTTRAAWGFELTALTPTNTVAGTFANTTTFTRTRTGGGRNYIEQNATGSFPGQTGGTSWTFSWTAPATDVGSITFYAAGLQADHSGDEDGDQVYTNSAAVPVGGSTATPTPTPTSTTTPATPTATPTSTPATPTPTSTPAPGTPTPTPSPAQALNISTRMKIETGDNVLIGGFIITGNEPKDVAARGIGPSLTALGIPDALVDPTLELHAATGALIAQNDDWQDDATQAAQLMALGLAPHDPKESGIVATLDPAPYTAILAGKNQTTGVGLVEIYDTNQAATSQLANLSTRGFVLSGSNVMIGGFILGGNANSTNIVLRGIGPTLAQLGLSPVLADPTLELHDNNGALLVMNNDWQDDPVSAAQLVAHGLAPQNPLEAGIFATLPPGPFTAILAGNNAGTGIGLIEIYNVH